MGGVGTAAQENGKAIGFRKRENERMPQNFALRPPRLLWIVFLGLSLVGGLSVVGRLALVAEPALELKRAWANGLLIANYLVGLAVGGLVLVALHYVTGARWSAPLRRLPEALAITLPVGALLLVVVLFAQLIPPSLYPWFGAVHSEGGLLRSLWLDPFHFLLRALIFLAAWLAFVVAMVRNSQRQDRTGDPALTEQNFRLSAAFLVVFGVTCWLSSYDWLMSLEPEWSSTVFGVYNFAGLFVSALAAVTLLAVLLRRFGPLGTVLGNEHLHDLGTLLFAFSSFWMYTWFCQYMLIWYTNHPEETAYFQLRQQGPWPTILIVNLVLNWAIPFVVLLFRPAKRSPVILALIACILLAGRWLDLYLMIFPSQERAFAPPGALEAGCVLGMVGLFGLAVCWALSRAPLVPVHDPLLARGSIPSH
jgi:hypothetical protein